jgi:hypothetical protein
MHSRESEGIYVFVSNQYDNLVVIRVMHSGDYRFKGDGESGRA